MIEIDVLVRIGYRLMKILEAGATPAAFSYDLFSSAYLLCTSCDHRASLTFERSSFSDLFPEEIDTAQSVGFYAVSVSQPLLERGGGRWEYVFNVVYLTPGRREARWL